MSPAGSKETCHAIGGPEGGLRSRPVVPARKNQRGIFESGRFLERGSRPTTKGMLYGRPVPCRETKPEDLKGLNRKASHGPRRKSSASSDASLCGCRQARISDFCREKPRGVARP